MMLKVESQVTMPPSAIWDPNIPDDPIY